MQRALDAILTRFRRVAITGGPKMGKSTLVARVSDRPVISTDSYIGMDWASVPHAIVRDCANLESFVLEGVMVPRALRKGLQVDAVIYLTIPKVTDRLPGQIAMAKGVRKVFDEWRETHSDVPVFIESLKTLKKK